MKRNRIRLCAGLLVIVMSLAGCSGGGTTEAVNPIDVAETHEVSNVLHKVNVTENDRPFVVNGASEYKIIAAEDTHTQKAAYYLQSYIAKATGCTLEFAKEEEYTAEGKFIVMNSYALFERAGLTMPEDELGVMGYYIKTVGDSVFLTSNYEQGARYAMLAFLRQVVGFKMYSQEVVLFEKDGATLPDMEIVEKPDITYFYRMHNQGDSDEETYMMGFINGGFISIDGNRWHNSLSYLPKETYMESHPGWYSTEETDICYTAHGDEAELEQMTTIIANRMLEEAEANPEALFVTCTIMDTPDVCGCDACVDIRDEYNGAYSAAAVKFTNKINAKVQSELQRQADEAGTKKRPLTVLFFAYYGTTQPPAVQDRDGNWTPMDESVVCDEGVAVFYAPIKAEFNHTFYEDENATYNKMMQGWAACSDEIFCWLYETNFHYYMYPYNSWDSMLETYRFCADVGTPFIMGQDQHNTQASSAFTDLKDYINSCAIFDLNQNYDDILEDYFTNYYQEAAEPMKTYFDELRAWMRHLETTYPTEVTGDIYIEIGQSKFWPKNLLEHWLELIDEAYEAAELYKDDVSTYKSLTERIKKESMFPRYALIEWHSGTYSEDVLLEMMTSFKEDATELGFTRVDETKTLLTDIYKTWGIQ